jgi:hypothetical protein
MSFREWKPYVPADARRRTIEGGERGEAMGSNAVAGCAVTRRHCEDVLGQGVVREPRALQPLANRLPRGRTYLRNGSVVGLVIGRGEVRAPVIRTQLYRVEVRVAAVGKQHWKALGADCAGSIGSVLELLQGQVLEGGHATALHAG